MPSTILWAWEEPEDLRAADPSKVGVAFLARTILLGQSSSVTTLGRRQPLELPAGIAVMAVVRIETRPGFRDSEDLRRQTAADLVQVSREPGLRALQIDFDATQSQHAFYAGVLRALRPQMPAGMPLSITALVSWCSAASPSRDWLASLPIDEAVPMFFRLGGHAQPYADKTWIPIHEPLCRGSIGLSTDESWPRVNPNGRVYLFAPGPWRADQISSLQELSPTFRPKALRQANLNRNALSSVAPAPAGAAAEPPVSRVEEP